MTSRTDVAAMIDHTLLKPEATPADVDALVDNDDSKVFKVAGSSRVSSKVSIHVLHFLFIKSVSFEPSLNLATCPLAGWYQYCLCHLSFSLL